MAEQVAAAAAAATTVPHASCPEQVLTALPLTPLSLRFANLTYVVRDWKKERKCLLRGLNGEFRSGELTALIGPSGAGKSTLLNVLAGYRTGGVHEGEVRVNGRPREARRFRKLSCYIMQDSELLPHLTVLEALQVAASLKLGQRAALTQRRLIIAEVLSELGLVECSHTMTAHLSGGQRKRLAIAQELVSNPPIMFFDEPTSGLDSSVSHHCISLLKSLAQGGRMIVCSIHQPSARIFEMFDQLYVLAAGQCIYRGAVDGLVPFLSAAGLQCPTYHNPADFVIEVASGEHGDVTARLVEACAHLDRSREINGSENTHNSHFSATSAPERDNLSKVDVSAFSSSSWTQFRVLLWRTLLCTVRDSTHVHIRLAGHLLMGLLTGLLYHHIGNEGSQLISIAGFMLGCQFFLQFTAMMPTIITFPVEKSVLLREHLNSWYSINPYFLARTLADIPFQVAFTTLFMVMAYFMSDQPAEAGRFFMVLLMAVLVSLAAQSLGLFVGAIVPLKHGVVLGPVIAMPISLFAGFFITFSTMPSYFRWMTHLSYFRYSFEGAMVAVLGHDRARLPCASEYCHFGSPERALAVFDLEAWRFWPDVAGMLVCITVIRLLAYLALRLKLAAHY